METPLLQLSGLGKSFGRNRVLHDVSFELAAGEVHLLAGENGAGKSTLIKIIGGIHADYDGTVAICGRPVRFRTPLEANRHGVSLVHQELSLIGGMSVVDNILLGREPAHAGGVWLDRKASRRRALAICRQLRLDWSDADLDTPVERLSLATKNRLEIAKALMLDVKILVLDEPTSALSAPEVERLFQVIADLKQGGCGIIYISHKMEEIYRIADRITVLRDGCKVGTAAKADCPPATLIRWMIGRDLAQHFPPRRPAAVQTGTVEPALDVTNFSVPRRNRATPAAERGVSFAVGPGEIVGIAELQGSGAPELFHGLFGSAGAGGAGQVRLGGKTFAPAHPRASIAAGLAFLTGDRKSTGIVPGMSVTHNLTLAALPRYSPAGWLRPGAERAAAGQRVEALQIRLASFDQSVATLSGGNQQKVVLAKWLETHPSVLLLEEPTRGVDVGAKHEIYELMNRLAAQGIAIVFISTELPELLRMSDRILVMREGEIAARFERAEATSAAVLAAAMGTGSLEKGAA